METETEEMKEAMREAASKVLSKIVGADGIVLNGMEEGSFAMMNNSLSVFAIVEVRYSEDKQYFQRQEIIIVSEIESVIVRYHHRFSPVKIFMKSGADVSFNLKKDADTGAILNLLSGKAQ